MIVVVADDISGATEIAGVCLRYGLRVVFTIEVLMEWENVDVVIIATDTRSMSVTKAASETRRLFSILKGIGVQGGIFKKIDSVLRGHILVELKEILEILGKSKALVVPANPEDGRLISKGYYYINGVPLNNTSFAEDPDFPAKFSEVKKILGMDVPCLNITGLGNLEKNIMVPDIESKEDLTKKALLIDEETFSAGSAAFFESYLKIKLGGLRLMPSFNAVDLGNKLLVVCGSTHENSREFVRKAKASSIKVVEMPTGLLKVGNSLEEIKKWTDEIISLLKVESKVIVAVSQSTVKLEGASIMIKEVLAKVVKKVLSQFNINELMVEGGATAFSIVRENGFKSFIPVNELEKGVVRMKVLEMDKCFLTIKPGSYSWTNMLLEG